jgi:ribosomal protein S26
MSKTQTKTATTAHGEVEYETVTCDSCGNEAAKAEASKFVMMHSMRDTTTWSHDGGYKEFEVYNYTEGWACKYCTQSPASYPQDTRFSWFKKQWEQRPEIVTIIALAIAYFVGWGLYAI